MFRSTNRSRRHRNAHNHDEQQGPAQPFFGNTASQSVQRNSSTPFFQAKLSVNQPNDKYEREADSVANTVVNNQGSGTVVQQKEISGIQRLSTSAEEEKLGTNEERMRRDKEIQTKPEIQRMCPECEKEKEGMVQQKSEATGATASSSLSSRIESSAGKGESLPQKTLHEMQSSFGVNFRHVNIHTDSSSAQMNKELNAQAFTHGSDIYFNSGKYNPETSSGKLLLAHELTHVVQQQPETVSLTRIGTAFTHTRRTSPYRSITATFDGRDFVLSAGGTVLMTVPAQSGRPYSVRAADATACGGSTSDSYLNNPRYVGIADNGPIPEGTYRFRANRIATFSTTEQATMMLGGSYTDPFGGSIHGGDWGAGRVALNPVTILPGPPGCGNTRRRSGFYLHGGVMPGSSGCIDIGDSGITTLLTHLDGYTRNITVTVRYTHAAPSVGPIDRALGRFTYPGQENPTVGDRLRSLFGGE
jgi:uncharacterized protein DUF4157